MNIPYDKFLVTGGAGFIGSHIAEYLINHGKKVVVLDNLVSGKMENMDEFIDSDNFEFIEGSITDKKLVDMLVKEVDVVFNEAASKCTVCYDDPVLDMMVNGLGTLNVVGACKKYNKELVHASSGSVMKGYPNSYYGISKWAGEGYIKQHNEPWRNKYNKILRYYHVYGSRQNDSATGGVIPIFIKQVYNNEPITIFGTGNQVRHFTSVNDVVLENMYIINNPDLCSVSNVVANVEVTIKELANMIQDIMNRKVEIKHIGAKHGDIFEFPEIYRDQLDIGYSDNFEKELSHTIDWYVNKYNMENK